MIMQNVSYGSKKNQGSFLISFGRGQFKIQQMAFMLLAVFLFFILAALFWVAIQARNVENQATFLEREKSLFIADFLSSSSEFSCTNIEGQYCIDTDKLIVLEGRTVYKEFWPVAFIEVRELDGNRDEVECNRVSYPNCNIYKVYENDNIAYDGADKGIAPGSYVALCRYEQVLGYKTKICEIGKLNIGYKLKT